MKAIHENLEHIELVISRRIGDRNSVRSLKEVNSLKILISCQSSAFDFVFKDDISLSSSL